jgi:hypothetical protein
MGRSLWSLRVEPTRNKLLEQFLETLHCVLSLTLPPWDADNPFHQRPWLVQGLGEDGDSTMEGSHKVASGLWVGRIAKSDAVIETQVCYSWSNVWLLMHLTNCLSRWSPPTRTTVASTPQYRWCIRGAWIWGRRLFDSPRLVRFAIGYVVVDASGRLRGSRTTSENEWNSYTNNTTSPLRWRRQMGRS